MAKDAPRVAIIMGSANDWDVMQSAEKTLDDLGIPSDARVISAHRTPQRLTDFTGAFAFTDPRNLEILVKTLDFGDRVLVIYGALSNLEYTLRITDTTTGAVISSPFSSATPDTLPSLTMILLTPASVRSSPPAAWNAPAIAFETEPMPPRARPQDPTLPSTSPM